MSAPKTINVVVAKGTNITVKASQGIIQTTTPVTLRNSTIGGGGGIQRLVDLVDVDSQNAVDGSTVVYSTANSTFTVELLNLENTAGTLDGGSF